MLKMQTTNPLQIFKYGNLLVIYWERAEKLRSEIEVECNGVRLAKPLMGIEFVTAPKYIIAGLIDKIPGSSQGLKVRILDKEGSEIASGLHKRPSGLARKLTKSWDVVDRIRAEKGLLQNVLRMFGSLSPSSWIRIVDSLAQQPLKHDWSPDKSIHYIRLPWKKVDHPGLLEATLRGLDSQGGEVFVENLTALVENEAIHLFSHELGRQASGDPSYCILEAGRECYSPIIVKTEAEKEAGVSGEAWLRKYISHDTTESDAIRGYATLELQRIIKEREVQEVSTSLRGQIDAHLSVSGALTGWVTDTESPQIPVAVEVLSDGKVVGEMVCDVTRANGLSNGFEWALPEALLDGIRHEISLCRARTHQPVLAQPFLVGADVFDVQLQISQAGLITGWVKERCLVSRIPRIRLLIDGELVNGKDGFKTSGTEVLTWRDETSGRICFKVKPPSFLFDTRLHQVQVQTFSEEQREWRLMGDPLPVQTYYEGRLERVEMGFVSGWIINKLCPRYPVEIEVTVNEKPVVRGLAHCPLGSESADNHRFVIRWLPSALLEETAVVHVRLVDNPLLVVGMKTLQTDYLPVIQALKVISGMLKGGGLQDSQDTLYSIDDHTAYWIRSELIREFIKSLRQNRSIPENPALNLASKLRLPTHEKPNPIIDVIVPVYGGRALVMDCLMSLAKAKNRVESEIIVIDDASTDRSLVEDLRKLSKQYGFSFYENPTNLGFPATANRGMRMHEDRDVVLLNSDTQVTDAWLDRLARAAYRSPNIATVTPLSNNATICSYPEMCKDNKLPPDQTLQSIDQICRQVNADLTVELPTAIGFCMYVRREAIHEVGYFDEMRWGKGYGEENDFSIRAAEMGWRNIAACDVFVAHEGGSSFGDSSRERVRINSRKLDELYPEYSVTVKQFIKQDPLRIVRRNISLELIRQSKMPFMLFIMHNLGGGIKRAVNDLAEKLHERGVGVLELVSLTQKDWMISCHHLPYTLQYRDQEFETMLDELKRLDIRHLHYHQTMHFPKTIWDLPERLGVNYDFTLHDYLAICPRISLIDETGTYCGNNQFSTETCNGCVRVAGLYHNMDDLYQQLGGDVMLWRAYHQKFLSQARRVIAPSQDSADRIAAHLDLKNVIVRPNLERSQSIHFPTQAQDDRTVAIIGGIGDHKGYQLLSKCVQNASKRGLDIKYMVIGYTSDDEQLLAMGNVTITGEYEVEQLPHIVASSGARIALFLSQTPETYSYALSEAWANRLFPIALDRGAIAERIRTAGVGRLLPVDLTPQAINDVLLEELSMDHSNDSGQGQYEWGEDIDVLREYYGFDPEFWR
ncbi:MAG: glycosyltransferase [Methylococcus sp.]